MDANEVLERLSNFSLFADLSRPQLEAITHTFDEEWFDAGRRVVRQGFAGTGFFVVLEGEASVKIDGEERDRVARGDFFGEMSVLLDEVPVADIVAETPLRCLVLARQDLRELLLMYPHIAIRMLEAELVRLRRAHRWRS